MNEVTTHYLEMKSPSSLKEKKGTQGLQIYECEIKQYQFNRFLYQLVGESWDWEGTKRVWVHTCTLDHPSALQNYKARDMTVYHTTTAHKELHRTTASGAGEI